MSRKPVMHTVLDTNVVVSAFLFRGDASAIHRAVIEGRIIPYISKPILSEYTRVFAYPKFRLTNAEIGYLLDHEIRPWFRPIINQILKHTWIREDPADDIFINAAQAINNVYLVSGDRHIIDSRDNLPVKVLTIREALDRLRRE